MSPVLSEDQLIKPKLRSLDSSSSSSSSFVLDAPAFSAAKRARLSRNYLFHYSDCETSGFRRTRTSSSTSTIGGFRTIERKEKRAIEYQIFLEISSSYLAFVLQS